MEKNLKKNICKIESLFLTPEAQYGKSTVFQ